MGRYYWNRKATVEESYRLKMPYLKKHGLLREQATGEISWTSNMTGNEFSIDLVTRTEDDPHIRLIYSVIGREGKKTDYNYEVALITTLCNFGGVRYWFCCPSCGMRVGVLYLAPSNFYFRCRHCNNLSYRSRNRSQWELFGHTSRQIESLQRQIKRRTWGGRPTKKVQRLHTLEQKMTVLSSQVSEYLRQF